MKNTKENNKELEAINDYLESLRMKIIFKEFALMYTLIFLGLILSIILNSAIFVICLALLGILFKTTATQEKKEFRNEYKRLIVYETFKEVFKDVYYDPHQGLDVQKIIDCDIITENEEYESSDYMTASLNDIHFECADVLIADKRYSHNDNYVHSFNGQWYIFDLKQKFMSDIQIIDKEYKYNKRIVEAFKKIKTNEEIKNFAYLETEDPEFNELYNLYTIVDFDAISFLTPEIIENLKELKKKVYGELIICVHKNKLHIGVNNFYDSYEPKIHKKINIENNKQKVRKELEDIANFIIEFNLLNTE